MRADTEFVGHPDEFRQRARPHLAHDLAAMNADGDLAGAEIGGGLFVREPRDDERQHLPFAGSKKSVVLLQLGCFRSFLTRFAIENNRSIDGLQQFLACVYALSSERRLLRYLYLAQKPE